MRRLSPLALVCAAACNPPAPTVTPITSSIAIAPVAVDFGNVPVGLEGIQRVEVTNSGRKTLTFQVTASTAEFLAPSASLEVSSGQSLALNVTFRPKTEGPQTGTFHFLSDASNAPDVTIVAAGAGVAATQCTDCNSPPAGVCLSSSAATTYVSVGACGATGCNFKASRIDCAETCDVATGKCVVGDGGVPVDGGTDAGAPVPDAGVADAGTNGTWKTGPWATCSISCGDGTRTRDVWCEQSDGQHVDASLCSDAQPEATSSCNLHLCAPTQCAAQVAWKQCSSTRYADGVHGDPTDTATCRASCGAKAAGCAKLIQYQTSAICVCHAAPGLEASTFPFTLGNPDGYKIFAGDCSSPGPTVIASCQSAACATTCGSMTAGQQCTTLTYFSDVISGSNKSPADCALSCGKKGAGCAKFFTDGQNHDSCVCHAATGIAPATGEYRPGNPKGLQMSSAECF